MISNTPVVGFDSRRGVGYIASNHEEDRPHPSQGLGDGAGALLLRRLKQIQEGRLNARRLGRYWYVVKEVEAPVGDGVVLTLFTHAGGAGEDLPGPGPGVRDGFAGEACSSRGRGPSGQPLRLARYRGRPVEETLLGLLEAGGA